MKSKEFKILFVGDTSFGENYQVKYLKRGKRSILAEKGYDYPFENLKPLLMQSDLVIANLETVVTNVLNHPIPVKSKKNFHWTDVEKAPQYFKKYNMRTFCLANNHMMDFGMNGLRHTLQILRENGMEGIGAGLHRWEARDPYLQEIAVGNQVFPLAVIAAFEYRKTYDQDFVFYAGKENGGVNRLTPERIARQIQKLKEESPGSFVVVFPHWGKTYRWRNDKQKRLAHKLIDGGADVVIGHGSHALQEVEQYKGKWVLYGIGNFIFSPGGRYEKFKMDPYSIAAQLCLQETSGGHLTKTLKVYLLCSDNRITDFRTRVLTGDEFATAHQRWLEKSRQAGECEIEVRTGEDEIGPFIELPIGDGEHSMGVMIDRALGPLQQLESYAGQPVDGCVWSAP